MLIRDITPSDEIPAYLRGYGRKITRTTTNDLIHELHRRGITVEHITGAYYAIEEVAGHLDDLMFGNDEEGQHGKKISKGEHGSTNARTNRAQRTSPHIRVR